MDAIWRVLDLAPTDDAIAIKRAYAKRLKTTRPDDDAAAYQRLREAYDRALAWARHRRLGMLHEDDGHDVDEGLDDDIAVRGYDVAAQVDARLAELETTQAPSGLGALGADDGFAARLIEPTPEWEAPSPQADDGFADEAPIDDTIATDLDPDGQDPWAFPDAIADGIGAYWQEHDDSELMALWPRVRADLDRIPIALRSEASQAMATLVLQYRRLPREFVSALAEHFQWGMDFRGARELGSMRMHALSEHLRGLGVLRSNDPAVQRRYADIRALVALRERGRRLRALLLSILLPERTFERWLATPDYMRNGLGIGRWAIDEVGSWLNQGATVRLALLALTIVFVTLQLHQSTLLSALQHGVVGAGLVALAWAIGAAVQRGFDALHARFAERADFLASRGNFRFAASVTAALAWAIASAVQLDRVLQPLQLLVLLLCMPGAFILAWTPTLASRFMLLPASLTMAVILRALLPDVPALSTFALASVWVFCANWLLASKFEAVLHVYRNPFGAYRPDNAWTWVWLIVAFKLIAGAIVVAFVAATPLTLLVQAVGFGRRFALMSIPLAAAIAYVLSDGKTPDTVLPLVALLLALNALALTQWVANRIAHSRFLR